MNRGEGKGGGRKQAVRMGEVSQSLRQGWDEGVVPSVVSQFKPPTNILPAGCKTRGRRGGRESGPGCTERMGEKVW